MTVAAPPNGTKAADEVLYTFSLNNGAWNSKISRYSGAVGGTILATSTTDYDFSNPCPASICVGAQYIKALRQTTTLDNGLSKKVEYGYANGAAGTISSVKEWDWYAGSAPASPLRETDLQYYASGSFTIPNVLDRVSTKKVLDGAGNVASQMQLRYDAKGNLTEKDDWAIAGGATIASLYAYDSNGQMISQTDPAGNKTTFAYECSDAYDSTITLPSTNGVQHQTNTTHDCNTGLVTSATGQNHEQTTFKYDNMLRPNETNFPDGGKTTVSYPDANTVKTEQKQNAQTVVTSFAYLDGYGRTKQTRQVDPEGDDYVDTAYDNIGQVARVSTPYRNPGCSPPNCELSAPMTYYAYDALGRIVAVTRPDGDVVQKEYAGNRVTVTDEAGKSRRTYSNAAGKLIRVEEPGAGADSKGTPGLGTITVTGSLLSKQVQTQWPASGTASFSIVGSVDQRIFDPCQANGAPSCPLTIYNSGSVSLTINGFTASTGYGGNPGQNSTPQAITADLASQFSSGSSPVTASYGGCFSFTVAAKAQGAFTNYLSTASATWNNAICPDGNPCFWSPSLYVLPYPGNGSVTLTGGQNAIFTPVYDSGTTTITINGQPISTSWSGPGTTAGSIASNLAAQITSSSSFAIASASGSTIYLTSRGIGANANYSLSSTSTYDSSNFGGPSFGVSGSGATLTGGTDPSGINVTNVTLYSYDVLGNLTCIVQKGQDATAFTDCPSAPAAWRPRLFIYDSLSRLTSADNPESGTVQYSYDSASNLISKTNARGITINFSPSDSPIDALNRVTKKTYSTGDPAVTYPAATYFYDQTAYNGFTISNGIGRLTSRTDASGAGAWSYDAMGRHSVEQQTINSITKSTSYRYDLAGNVVDLIYPDGEDVTYGFNAAGRPVSAVDNALGLTFAANATYAPAGQLTGAVYGSSGGVGGITAKNTYNGRMQPVLISAASSSQTVFSLGFDFHSGHGDNGNVYQIANNRDDNRTQKFSYDGLNRLQSAWTNGPKWGETFTIDAFGNLSNKGPVAGKNNYEMGLSAGAATAQNQLPGLNYDANGNMIKNGDSAYVYDAENRMTSTAGVTYTYDGDGTRVMRSDNTIDWGPGPLSRSDFAGNFRRNYIFFGGKRIARKISPANTVDYMFSDHLGSLGVMTDAAGTIEGESDYYPFGGEQAISGGLTSYKFTDYEHDNESGLDHAEFRQYGSNMGRFTASPVPIPPAAWIWAILNPSISTPT